MAYGNNEYEYNAAVKKGMKRDPEIEGTFRERAERRLAEQESESVMDNRYKENR